MAVGVNFKATVEQLARARPIAAEKRYACDLGSSRNAMGATQSSGDRQCSLRVGRGVGQVTGREKRPNGPDVRAHLAVLITDVGRKLDGGRAVLEARLMTKVPAVDVRPMSEDKKLERLVGMKPGDRECLLQRLCASFVIALIQPSIPALEGQQPTSSSDSCGTRGRARVTMSRTSCGIANEYAVRLVAAATASSRSPTRMNQSNA